MASPLSTSSQQEIEYPVSDGKPMAETPIHRRNLSDLIDTLDDWYGKDAQVHVSGNVFVYYVEGNPKRVLSPDVFVVKGIPPDKVRDCYKVWEEGKGPDLVIELTSRSTRKEDTKSKFKIYQNELAVPEYVLFDPRAEYLDPPLQGYRLQQGRYERIAMVDHRLPSEVLGLEFDADGDRLRLYDPRTRRWLPTHEEGKLEAEQESRQQKQLRRKAEQALRQAEAEIERLRRLLDSRE